MKAIASNGKEIQTCDQVLVRNNENDNWVFCNFSHIDNDTFVSSIYSTYCIPYKGNEHLEGTNKPFENEFKFKFGARVKAWYTDYLYVIGILIDYASNDPMYKYRVAYFNKERGAATNWFKKIEYLE